jgi:hypothetical protein
MVDAAYADEDIVINIYNPGTTPYSAIDANTFINAQCVLSEHISPYVFSA